MIINIQNGFGFPPIAKSRSNWKTTTHSHITKTNWCSVPLEGDGPVNHKQAHARNGTRGVYQLLELVGRISLSCWTERADCDQTVPPSICPETALSSAELKRFICRLADPVSQFWQMVTLYLQQREQKSECGVPSNQFRTLTNQIRWAEKIKK